ncbi:hypothetical protein [Pedobacter steynii]
MENFTENYYSQLEEFNAFKFEGVVLTDFKAFDDFVKLCKRTIKPVDEQYSLIFNTEYPSMIRRSLAMKLKYELERIPVKDETSDLKALIVGLQGMVKTLVDKPDAKDILKEILQPEPPEKKLTKKEQLALDAKELSKQRALKAIQKLKR